MGSPKVGTQGKSLRVRKAIASLLGPVVMALVIIARRPPDEHVTWPFALFGYVMAHILFWPAVITARLLGRRRPARRGCLGREPRGLRGCAGRRVGRRAHPRAAEADCAR